MEYFGNSAIGKFLRGKTFWGRVLFGILDAVPFISVHEIIKAAIRDELDGDTPMTGWQIAKDVFQRLDAARTAAAIVSAAVVIIGIDGSDLPPIELIQLIIEAIQEAGG